MAKIDGIFTCPTMWKGCLGWNLPAGEVTKYWPIDDLDYRRSCYYWDWNYKPGSLTKYSPMYNGFALNANAGGQLNAFGVKYAYKRRAWDNAPSKVAYLFETWKTSMTDYDVPRVMALDNALYKPPVRHNSFTGINVGFYDGHVGFIRQPTRRWTTYPLSLNRHST